LASVFGSWRPHRRAGKLEGPSSGGSHRTPPPQGECKSWKVAYLWYRWPGEEADRHAAELERFRAAVRDEVVFEARTYQEVFAVLRRASSEHDSYVRYLEERYFNMLNRPL
jgi:hypothetical protein